MRPYAPFATLVLLLSSAVSSASAQSFAVDRHVWQIGGSASFSSSSNSDGSGSGSRNTTLNLAPRLVYFILPGLAVGATAHLGHGSAPPSHDDIYGVGPEIAYYFGRGPHRVYPYLAASALVDWTHAVDGSVFDSTVTITTTFRNEAYSASAGVAVLLARNVAVTGEAYYASLHTRLNSSGTEDRFKENSYGIDFGVAVFLY